MTLRWALLTIVAASLNACATPVSEAPSPKPYTPAFQARLADELARLPDDYPAVLQAVIDYGTLRATLCRGRCPPARE